EHDPARDGQTKPRAASTTPVGRARARVLFEDQPELLRGDPRPRIANFDHELSVLSASDEPYPPALRGELERVVEQVQDDLVQPVRIAHEGGWHAAIDVDREIDPAVRGDR